MIALIAGLQIAAAACGDVSALPEITSVAWISPIGRQVRSNGWMEVVRTQDLRAWIDANSTGETPPDPLLLLQHLGMASRRGGMAAKRRYKVTVFDLRADWMCRPIADGAPGEALAGVSICEEPQQKAEKGCRRGFTGCGYTEDTQTGERGLDVYRLQWSSASSWGFCVFPLERFLKQG